MMHISEIQHLPDKQAFVMKIDEHVAKVAYEKRGGRYYLLHSEVPYALRGQGLGQILVEKTFDYLALHQMPATAVCSFIKRIAVQSPRWREQIA